MIEFPKVWSEWQHKNGNQYRVVTMANTQTTRPDEYPVTVVYENIHNGVIWSRKFSDWHRSMTEIR